MTEIFFSAEDSGGKTELWETDGTVGSAAELTPGVETSPGGGLGPSDFVMLGGTLYFNGFDTSIDATQLWKFSGGTATEIVVSDSLYDPTNLVSLGSKLYFLYDANSFPDGGLYVSDGSAAGSSQVVPTTALLPRSNLVAAGGDLVLGGIANADTIENHPVELFVSDGTAAGTRQIADPTGGSSLGLSPSGLTTFGGGVLFDGRDSGGFNQLYVLEPGLTTLVELTPGVTTTNGGTGINPHSIAVLDNGVALFVGDVSAGTPGLWRTDGTVAGTTLVGGASNPADLTSVGDAVLFSGNDFRVSSPQLYISDGTEAGTREVTVAGARATGLDPTSITAIGGGRAIFDGFDSTGQVGVWVTDGTTTTEIVQTSTDAGGLQFPGAFFAVACFAAGTDILTPDGPAAVETLCAGDRVASLRDRAVPVRWVGHRHIDCRRHPRPHDVQPIRIARGAFGEGMPQRPLRLSPDHAVFVDGCLIPVRYLVNGATIVQEDVAQVTYWHVELDRHDVILAEGLPCESYLDTGNRGAFVNGGSAVQLHPDFALRVWEARACAPLVRDGAACDAARRSLLARAAMLGHATTDAPDLTILGGGGKLPAEVVGRRWRVAIPEGTARIRLVSRTWIPAQARADEHDTRELGVAVSRLWLDGRDASMESPALSRGWQAAEPGWRWTDGNGELAVDGVRELVFEVALTGTYWCDPQPVQAASRSQICLASPGA